MELGFFMGLVTPSINFGIGHTVRMEQPSSQSSLTFYGLLCDVCLGWYLRPIVFPPMLQC